MRGKVIRIALLLLAIGIGLGWWFDLPGRLLPGGVRAGQPVLYGNVDIREVQLGLRVGGRIVETAVDEGDVIRAGDLMARLDATPYREAVAAAEAQVRARRAALDKLVNGPRPAEIARSRAEWDARLAELRNAELAFQRAASLRGNDTVAQAALDEATANRDRAHATAEMAEEGLRLLEEGNRMEDIEAARAELQYAEANLAASRTELGDTELLAPSDGIVLSRVREPGSIVSPGDVVFALSLTDSVWARAYIAEPDLGRIHPGMIVEVVTDSAPDRPYRGLIGFISPVAEFTPKSVETPQLRTDLVYRLRVIIDAPDEGLRQGMPVTVRLPAPPAAGDAG